MTTQNAGEMTVEECRDWLAVNYGWTKHDDGWRHPPAERAPRGWDQRSTAGYWASHPIGQTLDEAARLPEGWWMAKLATHMFDADGRWRATALGQTERIVAKGTTELEARFRLRVAVEMAERSKA